MTDNVRSSRESSLVRNLGLLDVTMIVIGSMIGSGIFIVSAESSRLIGAPGWLLLTWVVAGLLTITGALCCAELATMMPRAGGVYVFLREAYGPALGFLFGWTLFLVVQTGTIAAVAIAFARFLGVFVPTNCWRPLSGRADHCSAGLCGQSFERTIGRNSLDRVSHFFEHARTSCRQDRAEQFHLYQNGRRYWASSSLGCFRLEIELRGTGLRTGGMRPRTVGARRSHNRDSQWSADSPSRYYLEKLWSARSSRRPRGPTSPLSAAKCANRDVIFRARCCYGCGIVVVLYVLANVAYIASLSLAEIQNAPQNRVAVAMMHAIFGTPGVLAMAGCHHDLDVWLQ